uniref:Glycolipid transfer protein-like n=1 Tax=Phallusia mammillata TaxID=59560 RepID=A0A6F9DD01_9ASCI|nr:glycolipid transfer protein-like [Phallusia mammillata]
MPLLKPGFLPVPEDKRIKTLEFIEACEKIPGFFDLLGGRVFAPVKNDVQGNITKIKTRFFECPDKFETLEDIIDVELQEEDKKLKTKDGNGIATNALMWLKRGLKFILLFVEHLVKNDYDEKNPENLKACARLAYKDSLQTYHGWMVSQLVTAATNACPYRKNFMELLAKEENLSTEEVLKSASEFIVNFRATVDVVYELFDKKGVEKTQKA